MRRHGRAVLPGWGLILASIPAKRTRFREETVMG